MKMSSMFGVKAVAPVSVLAVLVLSISNPTGGASARDGQPLIAAEVETVSQNGSLVLADGTELCLAGIWVPNGAKGKGGSATWRSAWGQIISGKAVSYRTGSSQAHDRYGCEHADVEVDDGLLLHHALLSAGWAIVDPVSASDSPADIESMLRLEDQARTAGRGLWKRSQVGPRKTDDLAPWIGTRQLVEGRVRRVSDNDRYVYLNFGADWRTDFTARLNKKMMISAGMDKNSFDGRKLRIRGVLQESRGPLIDIAHLKQIEFLP